MVLEVLETRTRQIISWSSGLVRLKKHSSIASKFSLDHLVEKNKRENFIDSTGSKMYIMIILLQYCVAPGRQCSGKPTAGSPQCLGGVDLDKC